MKVSILCPFRNVSTWVGATITSIFDQNFSDWELICVNDHSEDNSVSIIRQFEDSRIRIIENQERGIIPALQLALKNSKGDFITRMDADDIMPEGRLQLMHDTLLNSPPKTVVTGKVWYFSEMEVSPGYRDYENWLNTRITQNDHFDHIYRECVVASPNWMVRKEDLIASAIFDRLKYPEDYDMVFQWMAEGFKIAPVNAVTLLWREHPLRTSRNSDIYNQHSFFQLKLDWFLGLEGNTSLAVIGAGPKGKITARFLKGRGLPFSWYDLKHENYKAPVEGVSIKDFNLLSEEKVLIAIYPKNQDEFLSFLSKKGYKIGENAWFL